jgi:uncharacterized protein
MLSSNSLCAEIAEIVRRACASPANAYGYGIWTHHVRQVVANGRALAEARGADMEIVELAALLHDYASIRDVALAEEHHVHGAADARRLLGERGYPPERVEAVARCILAHRASVPGEIESVEARCLADADAMTHIQSVPSLLHYAYCQRGLDIDAGAAWVRAKLQRTWNKLAPDARRQVQATYDAALAVLAPGVAHKA